MAAPVENEIRGYQFEPMRTDGDFSDDSSTSDNSTEIESDVDMDSDTRVGNVRWCKCGHCQSQWLVRLSEHTCCLEGTSSRTHAVALTDADVRPNSGMHFLPITRSAK